MKIDKKEVMHIAELSKLTFDDKSLSEMGAHLETVIGYFEMLDSVDTSKISPTAHIIDKINVLREDVKTSVAFDRDLLLANAPEKENGCYIVPRVVE